VKRRVLAVVVILAGACARPPAGRPVEACDPVPYALSAGVRVSDLSGPFELALVATSGDSSGRQSRGRLVLEPTARDDAALVGRTDIDVDRVGAYRVGAFDVSGDSAPGVLVFLRSDDPPSIMLRLGSGANARAVPQPIEGEFTVLLVHRLGAQGFAGSWRSGANVERAAGHFCASRLAEGVGS
jgi:hypothetical protein